MGLNKNTSTTIATAVSSSAPGEEVSATDAAIKRLHEAKAAGVSAAKAQYKQNNPDEVARGKTRCVQFEAALMSPAIAGMQFNNMKEYLSLVKEAADAGVAYSFQEE